MMPTLHRLRIAHTAPWSLRTSQVPILVYLIAIAWAYGALRPAFPDLLSTQVAFLGLIAVPVLAVIPPLLSSAHLGRLSPSHGIGSESRRQQGDDVEIFTGPTRKPHHAPVFNPAPDLRGERRRVTVMFADLSDSSSMTQSMDPEDMRDLINRCFDMMIPIVTEHGGTVSTFLGDGILGLFGAPVAHEDDPERCLSAVLRIQEALAELSAQEGKPLKMHFGINTGLVVAGDVGSSSRHDYSVTGDAVSLAARLQHAAGVGEIYVGPETHRLSSHRFHFQRVGPLRVKGWAEPVPAFKLLGVSAPRLTRRPVTWDATSSLVGRSLELALAMRCIERLKAGQGGVLAIVGEAGLGKSRFTAELRRLTDGDGLRWLEGGGDCAGQHVSYCPFVEIVRSCCGIASSDGETERWRKLRDRVDAFFPEEAEDLLPFLGALASIDIPAGMSDRLKFLDREAIGNQVFRAARKFFSALAETAPLVLAFEDVHSLDESAILLLEHLLPLSCETPLLVVVTGRPRHRGLMERIRQSAIENCERLYEEIRLSPLSPPDTTQLVRNLIHADDVPFWLRDTVVRKAEGNPLFVEEMVRALVDFGVLARDQSTGRWKTAERAEQITVPDTLMGVISARIDLLSAGAKDVLRLAAVIGRSFQYALLEGLAGPEQNLAEGLWELHSLGLISSEPEAPGGEFKFKHALVQEAAYESILLRQRQELHHRIAQHVETTCTDRLHDFYGMLAYHYTRAEAWTKAQEYLLKAGDQASKIAGDSEALAHYQHALAAYGRALGAGWDPMERAVLESKMGEALYRRGDHGHGRKHLERALKVLGKPYPTSRWGIRIATLREIGRQCLHRALPALSAGPGLAAVDPVSAQLSHQYGSLKWMDFFLDCERYLLSTLLLLNHAERSGHVAGIVRASAGLGIGLDALGLKKPGEFYCRRAATLAHKAGEPRAIGDAFMLLGIHEEYSMGRADVAPRHLRRGAAGYWEAGSIKGWAAATTLGGRSMARKGDFQGAQAVFRHVSEVAEDAAERQALGWGLSFEGEMLDLTGAFEEASSRLLHAIELFGEVPDHMSAALAQGLLGRCYMRWGKLSEAQRWLEEGRRAMVKLGLRGFMCSPLWLSLAEVDLAVAERADGNSRKAALARARASAERALTQGRIDALAVAPGLRIRGSVEYLRGKQASALGWWHRSLEDAETRGMRYELGLTHLEIGRRTGDRTHLRLAESLFSEMGAHFDLATTGEYLAMVSPGLVA